MSADFPLTPTEAIAFAALGEAHIAEKAGLPAVADLIPRWKSWADRLRRWGEANLPLGDISLNEVHADVTPDGGRGPIVLNIAPAQPQVIVVRRPRIDGYR